MIIGKTYWKSAAKVLSATAVMVWTGGEVERMQLVENKVWRQILGALGYTPIAALQGEIGASTVKRRDMKIKITFVQFMFRTRNGLLEGIFRKDKKKNQRTNKKHVYLKNKRFEHIKSSSSVLFLEI